MWAGVIEGGGCRFVAAGVRPLGSRGNGVCYVQFGAGGVGELVDGRPHGRRRFF